MSIQNIFIFLALFIVLLIVFFLSDKFLGSLMPRTIIFASILAFVSYFIVKKTNHNWTLVAVIIAAIALFSQWGWNAFQDYTQKKLHHQHVKPGISISMEYPIKVEDDKVFRNIRNPDIIVVNNGPIKAVSVSYDIKIYVYNKVENIITEYFDFGFKEFDHAVSVPELNTFDEMRRSTIGINGEDILAVYFVSVKYHRESDMEPFSLEKYFFTENRSIKPHHNFKNDSRYSQVMECVKKFDPSEFSNKSMLTAAAEHIWFFEPDPSHKVRKNPNGSITIAIPKEQDVTQKEGYPYLLITPKPFKATGFYTDAKIIEDHIEVKIQSEVKNSGDSAAMTTEDGFEQVTTIEPGQTKYYTKTIKIGRKKENQEPLENFIKLLDTKDRMFRLKFSIFYRPGNDMDKLFKSTVHYEIGKNKVMPITE